ncbi:hypothetical protein Tco_1470516, partial [Tanacetum coccineum]
MKTNQTHPWWWRGRGGVGDGEVVTWGQRGGGGSGGEWVVVMERARGSVDRIDWVTARVSELGRKTRRKSFSAAVGRSGGGGGTRRKMGRQMETFIYV